MARLPRVQESVHRGEIRTHRIVPSGTEIEEQLFSASSLLGRAEEAVKSSAFTAHTAKASDGMALPERPASRAVGATLNAARPACASGLVSYDVDAARVEPHLVAITQPRSAYCEQVRSLRTRILQAGEREQMRTFVITSAGMGEGKTLTALNLAWLLAGGVLSTGDRSKVVVLRLLFRDITLLPRLSLRPQVWKQNHIADGLLVGE